IGDSYHRAESPGPWTDNPCGTSLRQRKREYNIAIQLVNVFDFFTASDAHATSRDQRRWPRPNAVRPYPATWAYPAASSASRELDQGDTRDFISRAILPH